MYNKLIKSGQFEELKAQVFGCHLSESSEGTCVGVLDEDDEKCLAEAICNGNAVAAEFAKAYYKKYAPFNSAVLVLLGNINTAQASDVMYAIIKRWSLPPELAEKLCRVALGCNALEDMFRHIKAFVENPGTLTPSKEVFRLLVNVDGKWNEKEKLAEIYLAQFKEKDRVFSLS